MKKTVILLLTVVMVLSLVACGGNESTADTTDEAVQVSETAESNESDSAEAEEVELKFFSNVPDRTAGLGLLEEGNLEQYKADNPNTLIETEQLQDEPYKVKLQTYMQSGEMPDVWMQWGTKADLTPVVQGGLAEPLNKDDYADYGFVPGALDAFTVDGVLYGLPKNVDFWVLFYNEKILADNGIEVPTTTDELIAAADILNAKGIIPVSLTGKDQWPIVETIENLILRCSDDQRTLQNAVIAGETSGNEALAAGANEFLRLEEAGVFQPSFNSDDYGTAKNLFTQGKAAMYLMGSWEMGMAADQNIEPEVRDNIRAAKFPTVEGYNGSINSVVMWYGGGYSVSSSSENKEEAIELLNYMLSPDVYAKNAWEKQIVIPPMDYSDYMTGEENQLQVDLSKILNDTEFSTGDAGYCTLHTAAFKADSEILTTEFATRMISTEEFFQRLDELVAQNAN